MDTKTAHYVLERKAEAGAEWCQVTLCASLDYAELLAATGVRRGLGVSYRVIDRRSDQETPILPEPQATAA